MNVGFQTQRLDHTVPVYFIRAKAGVVKIINPQSVEELNKVRVALPNATFIFRKHFGSQPLDNPKQRAVQVYDAIMPHASQFKYDLIEGYNEVGYWGDGPNYNIFTVELSKLLHAAGQKHLAYSFGVGHPAGYAGFPYEQDPLAWLEGLRCHWAVYLEGLAEADALGLHQYKLPQHNDKFTLFRHRLVRQALPPELRDIEIYLTEFGLDHEGNPLTSGFKGSSWNWSPEQYAAWLIETVRAIGKEVDGIAIFICGSYGWDSFDVLGHPVIADAIARVNEEGSVLGIIDIVDRLSRSRPPQQRSLEGIKHIVVHHAAAVTTPERTARYHVAIRGWPTIGYHYFITEDGTTYKTARLEEMTYHVGEHNATSVGICLSGAYHGDNPPPTQPQQNALVDLVVDLQNELGLGNEAVKGHYELRPTLCPGSEWFEEWRKGLAGPTLEQIIAELEAENAQMRDDIDFAVETLDKWRAGG